MRYVFFTNTPAHVHLYKHVVRRLLEDGHAVTVLARDYGCTRPLLEYFELPHLVYGACGETKRSLFRSLPGHFVGIARAVRRLDPDHVFGMGAYAAFAGLVAGARPVLVLDSEPTGVDHAVSRRLARAILTPAPFRKDLGGRHYRFEGFKECAYLHPTVFERDPAVRSDLGLGPDERFALVRFNAFGSHHDIGRRGFAGHQRRRLLDHLAGSVRVFVSSESSTPLVDRPNVEPLDLHPARVHDVLAEASLLVADSQTMVTEAALLGTPAIRSNSFVGTSDMGNFLELERQGLVRNVRSFDEVLETATELLEDETAADRWRRRRDAFMAGLVDLSELIYEVASDPDSVASHPRLWQARQQPEAAVGPGDVLGH